MKVLSAMAVLEKYATYANTRADDQRLIEKAKRLSFKVNTIGVYWKGDNIDIDGKFAADLHFQINRVLDDLVNGSDPSIFIKNWDVAIGLEMQNTLKMAPMLYCKWAGVKGMIFIMLFCMMLSDAKEVTKCLSCGKYSFRTGRPSKYCNNTCRQKNFRSKKTPEELKQENAERREEYRIKNKK